MKVDVAFVLVNLNLNLNLNLNFVLVNVQYAVEPKTYAGPKLLGEARGAVLCSEWLTLPGIPARVRR